MEGGVGQQKLESLAVANGATAAARYGLSLVDIGDDDANASGELAGAEEALPTLIWIAYGNAAGAHSERVLTLRRISDGEGGLQVQGWCHLRRSVRTFRSDRIAKLVCLATGECPDDVEDWLRGHARFGVEAASPSRELKPAAPTSDYTRHALRLCRDHLSVLAYLARSDGSLDPDEVEVMVDFVMMSTEREISREAAAAYIRRLAPDFSALTESVARLARSPQDHWRGLARAMRRLSDADGRLDGREQSAWLETLETFEAEREASLRGRVAQAHAKALEDDWVEPEWLAEHLVEELASRVEVDPQVLVEMVRQELSGSVS